MGKKLELLNHKVGRLTVIAEGKGYIRPSNNSKNSTWICLCECGTTKEIVGSRLTAKNPTQSCGCLNRETTIERNKKYRNIKHGLSKHPLYDTWLGMNRRCNDPKNINYSLYGKINVTVCQSWHQDNPYGVLNFILNMYPSYLEALKTIKKPQLDKDILTPGNKIYSKDKCIWVSPEENSQNKRNTCLNPELVKYVREQRNKNVRLCDLAKELNINKSTICLAAKNKTWNNITK